jgi:hypothetical protein
MVLMTDEELKVVREKIEYHNHDRVCLSMLACCGVGSGEVAEELLAEVERLREAVEASDSIILERGERHE